jgi:hypothetical protein
MKLNVKAFALTGGIVWGFNWFILTWWMMAFDGITHEVTWLGSMYRGFTLSPQGSLVALVYGFVDGFFLGLFAALIYNWIAPRISRKSDPVKNTGQHKAADR